MLSQKFFPKEKINRDILSRKENQLLWTFRNYELFVLKFANNEIPFIYKSKANGQMKVNKNTKQNQQKHLLRLRKSVCDINNGIDWHVNLFAISFDCKHKCVGGVCNALLFVHVHVSS